MTKFPGTALAGAAYLVLSVFAAPCSGQDQPAAPAAAPAPPAPEGQVERRKSDLHRVTFGVLGAYIVTGTMVGKDTGTSTSEAGGISVDYNGSAKPQKYDYGPLLELRINRRFSLAAGMMYHPVKWSLVTSNTYNPPVPRGVLLNATSEQNRARVFDIPAVIRLRNITLRGPLSHVFVEGGGAMRVLSNIKSSTTMTYSDSTTSTSNAPVHAHKQTTAGVVGGAGLRFTDELGIHVAPEVRYTHWFDSNIVEQRINFPKDQVEVGLSFSF